MEFDTKTMTANPRRRLLLVSATALVLALMVELVSGSALLLLRVWKPEFFLSARIEALYLNDPEALERQRNAFVEQFHDPELGWEPRPGEITSHAGTPQEWSLTTTQEGARASFDASLPVVAMIYGDSSTRGAEVNDYETWTYVIEERSGYGLRNYGVGGYSLHQAILRFEKHIEEGRHAPIVVLAIHGSNLARSMTGLNAHAGSIIRLEHRLMFRPWVRARNGGLVEFENPWTDPYLDGPGFVAMSLENAADDYFVERKFIRFELPFALNLVRGLYARISPLGTFNSWADDEAQIVFAALIRRFLEDCEAIGAEPFFVFLPDSVDVKRERGAGQRSYTWGVSHVRGTWPDVTVLDVMDKVDPIEFDTWFVRPLSGHAAAYGNRRTAEIILPVFSNLVEALESEGR